MIDELNYFAMGITGTGLLLYSLKQIQFELALGFSLFGVFLIIVAAFLEWRESKKQREAVQQ